jgi:hypothetical protein
MTSEEKELNIIDIIKEFFAWIGRILKKMGMEFLSFIRFSFQKIWTLLIFFVLGVIAAIVLSFCFRTYESNVVLKLNVSDSYTFNELTKSLDAEIVSDKSLADRLNITDSIADNIVSIKPHFVIDNNNNGTADRIDEDDEFVETVEYVRMEDQSLVHVRMKDQLSVTVRSKDLYSFPVIQEGLVYFYSNNEMFKKEKEIQLLQQQQTLDLLQREINRLDSLSNYEYFKVPKNRTLMVDSQAIMLGEKAKQLYYVDITQLKNKKDSIQKVEEIYGTIVTVIKPFTVSKAPVNSLPKLLVICCFSFLLLGYIVALCSRYKNQIWTFLNEKK